MLITNYWKSDVSLANNLGFETKFSGKSFMYIKESNGPAIESWGTPLEY